MFERYTDRARRVIVIAREEAVGLGHDYIGTEHILLGLLVCEGLGAQALAAKGVTLESARAAIEPGTHTNGLSQIPLTPRAKKVLELALREALQFGHDYIGTEHLLLAITTEGKRENQPLGGAFLVLNRHEVSLESVRQAVVQIIPKSTSHDRAGYTPKVPVPGKNGAPVELTGAQILLLSVNELKEVIPELDGTGRTAALKILMTDPDDGSEKELVIRFGTEFAQAIADKAPSPGGGISD